MSDKETILSLREYIAGQDLRNKRARAVRVNTNQEVVLADPANDFHGILFNRPNVNERVEFVTLGDTIGFFAEDVDAGKPLTIDSNGELVLASGLTRVIGWAKVAGKANQPSPIWVDIKGVYDATGGFASVQLEVDAIETSVGLNSNGTLPAYSGTNHLNSAVSIKGATVLLDTEIGPDVTPLSRSNNQLVAGDPVNTNVDKLDSAIGVNVTSTNYANTSNTINQNISALDVQLGNLIPGTTVQAWDANLQNIADFSDTPTDGAFIVGDGSNFVLESGSVARASLGLSIGSNVQAWDSDLDAIAALSSTGFAVRSASNTWIQRSLTGSAGNISVVNGDGVSGNPTFDLVDIGTPISASFVKITTDAKGRITATTSVVAGDITPLIDTTYVNANGDTMTADLNMGANYVLSSGTPTLANHLTNKSYVDSIATGNKWKAPVRLATTSNITLSGEQTIDGFLTSTDDILVKNQSTASENGIYTSAAGAWSRRADADADSEVVGGLSVRVSEGTLNGDSGWVLTTDDPIIVGTTALTFVQFDGATNITAGIGLIKTGNTLDVNLGAGIAQLPTDEVGIDLFDASTGAIILTTTGSNRSTATAAQLHLLLDSSSLTQGSAGLKVANNGITEVHLNTSIAGDGITGGGGTPLSVDNDTTGSAGTKGTTSFNASKLSVDLGSTSTTAAPGNHNHSVDGLSNVSLTGIATNDFFVRDGANWVNKTPTQVKSILNLVIGTDVQAWDINLDQIAALSPTDNNFLVGNGTSWTIETPSQARTSLGLVSGGDGDIWVEKSGDIMTGDLQVNAKIGVNRVPVVEVDVQSATDPTIRATDTTNSLEMILRASNTVGHVGTNTNHGVEILTNNTSRIVVDTSGRTIISGAVGGGSLDSSATGIYFQKQTAAAEANIPFIRSEGDGTTTHLALGPSSSSGTLRLYTGGLERFRVDNAGNSVVSSNIYLNSTPSSGVTNASGAIRYSTAGQIQISADPSNSLASSNISFDIDGTTRGTINNSGWDLSSGGYLAIGSTQKLYLDGGGDSYQWEPASNQWELVLGGTPRIRINSSGDIGMNTDTPDSRITVDSSGGGANSLSTAMTFGRGTTNRIQLKTIRSAANDDADGLTIGYAGTEWMRLRGGGTELNSITGALLLNRLTTTERNALTATNGMLIYNTTDNKFQGYENGAWTNLI